MSIYERLHPELHPGEQNDKRGALPNGSLPRPNVARAAGLEPTTYGLEDRCSIH